MILYPDHGYIIISLVKVLLMKFIPNSKKLVVLQS